MVEHHQQHEGTSSDAGDTVELLYAHHDALRGVEGQGACEVVGNVIAQQIRVYSRADRIDNPVADESGNGQPHEEVLERHELLEIECQCDEEDRIAERADEGREVEHLNVYYRTDKSVHTYLVD